MTSRGKVLVTGASGFLGRRVTEILEQNKFQVRALVRKTSRIGNLDRPGVEIFYGDIIDADSLVPAFEGIDYIVHAAADTSGTEQGASLVTIGGTRNILDLCQLYQVKKLVYISSCSVYAPSDYVDGHRVDENASLEKFPERRGIYSWAKLTAEKIVLDYSTKNKVNAVCLRPGMIYGPGGENYSPTMGFSIKSRIFAVIHKRGFYLPLVYVDNLIHAITAAMTNEKSIGQVYNVIDSELVSKTQYMDGFIRKLYPDAWFIYIPYSILAALVGIQERGCRVLDRKPVLTTYRLISSQKPVIFDSSKIVGELKWHPLFSFEEAVEQMLKDG